MGLRGIVVSPVKNQLKHPALVVERRGTNRLGWRSDRRKNVDDSRMHGSLQ